MNAARTLPDEARQNVISFDVLINGERIPTTVQILAISVSMEVNKIPKATLVVRDGEAADSTFAISDGEQFIPGNEILIKLGRDSKNAQVFQGLITRQSIQIQQDGNTNLVLECRDESVKMTIGRKNRYYENQKDSEIIEDLIRAYPNLTAEVEDTEYVHPEMVQHHTSDWDMLVSRAELNGQLVIVENGTIRVKAPDTEQDPVVELLYGSTIHAYSAEMDARWQWANVQASSWDYVGQEVIQRESSQASFVEAGNISSDELSDVVGLDSYELRHSGQVRQEELQAWADACMLKSRLAKIRGRAQILVGNHDLKPDTTVKIQGVGTRFSGKVYITAVRHEVNQGKWDTHIQFGLAPEWFARQPGVVDFPAAGLIPPVHGLQIGVVNQLEDDPEGEDRIQIKLPVIDPSAAGIWCRVASPDAGQNRGIFWRPDVGDEVVVGFLNDDPRDAVVLGGVHSSTKPAPIQANDDNHEKGIVTRAQMRLHFKEDSKTITLETPGGNRIILDESDKSITITDQNSNTIKMTPGPGGIDIESLENINIKAGKALTLSAGTSFGISAPSVSMSADGSLSISGATTEVAAQGANVISGFPVNIN